VSCTCKTAVWALSHIALVASPRSGQLTPTSYETSILQTLARSLVSQLEFVLLRFLAVDLERLMSLLQQNLLNDL
jgi:hypothetical protein